MDNQQYANKILEPFPNTLDKIATELGSFFATGNQDHQKQAFLYVSGLVKLFQTIDPREMMRSNSLGELAEHLPELQVVLYGLKPDTMSVNRTAAILVETMLHCDVYLGRVEETSNSNVVSLLERLRSSG